jgi:hypothetical protein
MTLLAIPNAISSAVSELSHHGHKKGVHGGSGSSALSSTSSSDDQSGTTQSLFGSLLDSAEQLVGIQSPTTTAAAAGVNASLTNPNSGQTTAQMISAARAALHKAV